MRTESSAEATLEEHANSPSLVSSTHQTSVAMIDPPAAEIAGSNKNETRDFEIRQLAYQMYLERGSLDGQALQDWLDAEAIIRRGGQIVA